MLIDDEKETGLERAEKIDLHLQLGSRRAAMSCKIAGLTLLCYHLRRILNMSTRDA